MKRWLAIAITLTSCAVPVESEPRPIDVTIGTSVVDTPDTTRVELLTLGDVYFVAGPDIVAVPRQMANDDLGTLLAELVEGPNAAERGLSIRSAIPPETQVLAVDFSGGVVTVDLSREFTLVGGDEEIVAIAQIVATLSSRPKVEGVLFAIDGTTRSAPTGEGLLVERPLTIADFGALITG
jgi:spore germination protein GerM